MNSEFEDSPYEIEDFYTFSDGVFDPPPEVKEAGCPEWRWDEIPF